MKSPFAASETKEHRKTLEQAIFAAKFTRRMREDLLPAETVAELLGMEKQLKQHLKAKNWDDGLPLAEAVQTLTRELHPAPKGRYGLRENLEVFVVVMAVILGIRTYFLQPYQIPTGSMQPTLFGINGIADHEPDWTDRFPANIGKFLLTGSRFVEITAHTGGRIPELWGQQDGFYVFDFGGRRYRIHRDFARFVQPGQVIPQGHVMARGLRKQGDFIVVDRLTTNFIPPRRGDITVFTTRNIDHRDVRPNSAYIKRLVGLPGETVAICRRELVVNGEVVRTPEVFERQQTAPGYQGFANPSPQHSAFFNRCEDSLTLGEDEFLFFGDNTMASLDSRFFGGVDGRNIIGRGFFVPWPFFQRGPYNARAGLVR